jgi:hypothetical protein
MGTAVNAMIKKHESCIPFISWKNGFNPASCQAQLGFAKSDFFAVRQGDRSPRDARLHTKPLTFHFSGNASNRATSLEVGRYIEVAIEKLWHTF